MPRVMKTLAAALFAFTACATATTDTTFHLVGHVDAPVTYVVASTTSRLAVDKIASLVDPSGAFDLALEPGYAWSVAFIDSRQVGSAMVRGSLAADQLDAFAPTGPGSVDLGHITFSERARPAIDTETIVDALGLDRAVASQSGITDNLATRYANPDVDNDGVLDALEPDRDYRLDFLARIQLTNAGHPATIADLVLGMPYLGVDYVQTGIVVSLPPTGHVLDGALMAFSGPFYGTQLGPTTPVVTPGGAVAEPELKLGTMDGYPTVGAFAQGGRDLPRGEYTLALRDEVLTFSEVQPPRAADLVKQMIVPVMQLVSAAPGCVAECPIEAVRVAWMREADGGWITVEPSELQHGAHLDIVRASGSVVSAELPATPTVVLPWQTMAAGVTPAEMATITTNQLCFVELTYDDEVGMHVTTQVTVPDCH